MARRGSGSSGPPYGNQTPYGSSDPGLFRKLVSTLLLRDLDPASERKLFTAIGVGALVGALALVALPWLPVYLVGPFLPLLVLANPPGVVLLAVIAGGFGLWSVYSNDDAKTVSEPTIHLPSLPRDREQELGADRAGERLNTLVDRVTGASDNPSTGVNRAVDKRQVRKKLRDAAVDVLRERNDWSIDAAQDRIDDGSWTESRRAAAFLGGPEAPQPTLETRIRDWANGNPFERRVHATVDEIVRVAGLPNEGPLLDADLDRIERTPDLGTDYDLRTAVGEGNAGPNFDLDTPGGVTEAELAGFDDAEEPVDDATEDEPPEDETDDTGSDRDWSAVVDDGNFVTDGADETTSTPGTNGEAPIRETERGEST